MNERLQDQVRQVIQHLVRGEFAELEELTNGERLSAQDLAEAVKEYGRELVQPPDDAFRLMDVVQVNRVGPPQWSIRMPLWTREEARSDLAVSLTVIAEGGGFRIELDDIHVP